MRGITKLFTQVGRRGLFGLTALLILASQLIFAAPVFAVDVTLNGKVTSSLDGTEIANASLGLLNQSTGTFTGFGTTNATGDYSITVSEGTYTVFVQKSGYQTKSISSVDLSSNLVLNITLDPTPVNHTYSGTLKDQNGDSLGDAAGGLVKLRNVATNSVYTGSVNASTGAFSFQAPAGQYILSAEIYKNGFNATVNGSDPVINLNADVNQDLVVKFVNFDFQILNADGTPAEVTLVLISQSATGPQLLPDYQTLAHWPVDGVIPHTNTDSNDGIGSLSFLPGEQCDYEVWVMGLNDPTTRLMVFSGSCGNEDGSRVVHLPSTEPPAVPQNLSALSPTNIFPALTWDAVSEADSYKIFRNGEEIDITSNPTYVDNNLTINGTYSYTVSACNEAGCSEQSTAVTVVFDTEAPELTAPEWSANPIPVGEEATLTVGATDNLSGVGEGEYFIGNDPGEGNGTPMTLEDDELRATLGADFPIGTHAVNIRARDQAGNWSQVITEQLTIQDVTPPVVGHILSATPNSNGWFSSDVTIDWQSNDPAPSSGAPTDPPNTVASTEGTSVTYMSAPSCDPAGNCATGSAQLSIDKTNPTTSTPTMTGIITIPFLNITFLFGNTTNISANVGDNLSGVVRTEYYFDTDPGQGNGTTMNLSGSSTSGTATATADVSGLGGGQHTLYVRSQDASGRWSAVATRTFLRL